MTKQLNQTEKPIGGGSGIIHKVLYDIHMSLKGSHHPAQGNALGIRVRL
jgi:hypothetical protein